MRHRLSKTAKVLVTGGTGFIGSHVVEALVARNIRTRVFIRRGRPASSWIDSLDVERVEGDAFNHADLDRALDGVSHIIHVAGLTKAKSAKEFIRVNVDLTRMLIEAAHRHSAIQRFCFMSSLAAAGPSADGHLLTEDAPYLPITLYGRTKVEAERLCHAAGENLPFTIIRPPAVYGPRDRDTLEIFRTVKLGIKPLIGPPGKTLSIIHVQDLAQAVLAATFDKRAAGRTYFASNPKACSFDEVIDLLAEIMGKRPVPIRIPVPLLFGLASIIGTVSKLGPRPAVLNLDKARDVAQPHWVCSSARIEQELGFFPSIPIARGFGETYSWYRQRRWL